MGLGCLVLFVGTQHLVGTIGSSDKAKKEDSRRFSLRVSFFVRACATVALLRPFRTHSKLKREILIANTTSDQGPQDNALEIGFYRICSQGDATQKQRKQRARASVAPSGHVELIFPWLRLIRIGSSTGFVRSAFIERETVVSLQRNNTF